MSADGPTTVRRRWRHGPLTGDTLASLAAIAMVGGSLALHGVVVGRTFGDEVLGHAGLALAVGLGVPQLAGSGLVPAITRFTAARRASGDLAGMRRAAWGGLLLLVAMSACIAALGLLTHATWAPRIGLPAVEVAPALLLAVIEAMYIGLKALLYGFDRARAYARFEMLAGMGFLAALAWLVSAPSEARTALVAPFIVADVIFILLAAPTLMAITASGLTKGGLTTSSSTKGDVAKTATTVEGGMAKTIFTSEGDMVQSDLTKAGAAPGAVSNRVEPVGASSRGMGMAAYAAHASIGTGASIARLRLVPIALGMAYGAGEVGLLQAALVFFGPVMLIPRAVELALFPTLAGAHGRGDTLRFGAQAAAASQAIALGLALIAGGLIVAGPAILGLAFGEAFEAAAYPLAFVIVAAWCLGLAVPAIVSLSGADGIAIVNLSGVLGLITSLIAWALLVPPFGALGAAAGLALGSLPTALVPIRAAASRYGLGWHSAAVTTAIAVVASGSIGWAVRDGGAVSIAAAAAYSLAVLILALPLLRGRAVSAT